MLTQKNTKSIDRTPVGKPAFRQPMERPLALHIQHESPFAFCRARNRLPSHLQLHDGVLEEDALGVEPILHVLVVARQPAKGPHVGEDEDKRHENNENNEYERGYHVEPKPGHVRLWRSSGRGLGWRCAGKKYRVQDHRDEEEQKRQKPPARSRVPVEATACAIEFLRRKNIAARDRLPIHAYTIATPPVVPSANTPLCAALQCG